MQSSHGKPSWVTTRALLPPPTPQGERPLDATSSSRIFARRSRNKRRSGGSKPAEKQSLSKVGNTWINWTASLLLLLLICFCTATNLYYQLQFNNVVKVTFPETYAAESEWSFGADHSGVLDISLVYNFIQSDSLLDVTRLVNALLASPPGNFTATTPCVSNVGQDPGSLYAFCDHFDPAWVPEWARSFDAIIIQTFYLGTVEDYRISQSFTPYLGVAQGFRNTRTGWFEQETLERLYCTTQQLASASSDVVDRVLYTKAHGVLRNVDCSAPEEASTDACVAIRHETPFVLFGDGTGILRAHEVVRQADGKDFILGPFSSKERIGQRTDAVSVWPIDDCLYVRKDSIGWFGAGFHTYYPCIPTLALVAKLELISLLFVEWFVKFRCALNRAHHALFHMSRLGFFILLVAQMLVSAYQEQDIMRTIYSWKRSSVSDWILFLYILSTVALAGGLLALAVLRLVFDDSICRLGAAITMILPIPIAVVEVVIAELHYKSYTMENGLQTAPSLLCEPGYVGCAPGKSNYLFIVILMSLVPTLVEMMRSLTRSSRALPCCFQSTRVQPILIGHLLPTQGMTTFEELCLDGCLVTEVITDCDQPYVDVEGDNCVRAILISACGFTVIKHRFVVRTKDLVLLLTASTLPSWMNRDVSMVVWPLKLRMNGTMCVTDARRVFLRYLNRICVHDKYHDASLLCSDERPLA